MPREIEVFINGRFFQKWKVSDKAEKVCIDVCRKVPVAQNCDDVPSESEMEFKRFTERIVPTGNHTGRVSVMSSEIYCEGDKFYLRAVA